MSANSNKKDKTPSKNWVLKLGSRDGHALQELCAAQTVISNFEEIKNSHQKNVLASCLKGFVKKFFRLNKRPANPYVISLQSKSTDCKALFVFNDKYKINVLGPSDDQHYCEKWGIDTFTQALVEAGIKESKANKFVASEVQVNIVQHYLSLHEMLEGRTGSGRKKIEPSEVTRSAGIKLAEFLNWNGKKSLEPLSAEEKDAISYLSMDYSVNPGMLERVWNYFDTADELLALFKVVQPVLSIKNHEFGVSDSPNERISRLQGKFVDVFHCDE